LIGCSRSRSVKFTNEEKKSHNKSEASLLLPLTQMAHGKQRFKSNKQGKPKSYGNSSRSQRNFKSAAHDAVISQVMAKVTGMRKHQQWNKTSRNQGMSTNENAQ
jgi:hypothetical protein